MSQQPSIYLCAPQRTAIGSFQGSLSKIPAPQLGAHCLSAVLAKAAVPKESIEGVILGCVLTAGQGQAPARQATLVAGLSKTVQALTVNKVCSSGLKAIMLAANEIQLGQAEAVLAGGMENMSRAPFYLPSLRNGARLGHAQVEDSIIKDGLWDVYNNYHMGSAAELCARTFHLTREQQDDFAVESYKRAQRAIAQGFFAEEIAAIDVLVDRASLTFAVDEEPGKVRFDKISQLKPVFEKDGTVTAANASSISDGAAAMLVVSEAYLKQHNVRPLARILAQGSHGQEPEWFTTAPVGAMKQALARAGKKITEVDLFEINEAFSAVSLACMKDLSLDPSKVNVNGGAVALGHPIGASGARILGSLVYSLHRRQAKIGLVAICNGGGEATALLVEKV